MGSAHDRVEAAALVALLQRELGKPPTEIDISAHTGLPRGVIRRSRLTTKFFQRDSWGTMLELMDARIDVKRVRTKASTFGRPLVAGARQYTNWRNIVSHKPKTLGELPH